MSAGIDQKVFYDLLDWLGEDREEAARQYEHIRRALIQIFLSRGCSNAEDLADETIDRVGLKVGTLGKTFQGEKINYFMGVARNIIKESRKNKEIQIGDHSFFENLKNQKTADAAEPEPTSEMRCLKECLNKLDANQKELILAYYDVNRADKIQSHKKMSENFSKSDNAFRNRIFRVRKKLFKCFSECLSEIKRDVS